MLKNIIIGFVFLLGLYYVTCKSPIEGFRTRHNHRCPDILIQKGNDIFLFNSKKANVPGVNPIRFDNLEDYVQFTEWQRSQGIRCPVLYLQHSYDAQGKSVYKARPGPDNLQGGLPDAHPHPGQSTNNEVVKLFDSNRNDPPYNKNSYPGYDHDNQYIGVTTPLDKMFNEANNKVSPNPMDTTWGGNDYTQSLVDSGYYSGNNVNIATNS